MQIFTKFPLIILIIIVKSKVYLQDSLSSNKSLENWQNLNAIVFKTPTNFTTPALSFKSLGWQSMIFTRLNFRNFERTTVEINRYTLKFSILSSSLKYRLAVGYFYNDGYAKRFCYIADFTYAGWFPVVPDFWQNRCPDLIDKYNYVIKLPKKSTWYTYSYPLPRYLSN